MNLFTNNSITPFVGSLGEGDFELLRALVRLNQGPDRPTSLRVLSAMLEVSPSLLSRRLRKLHEEGWVERRQVSTLQGREVQYVPRGGVDVRWLDPELGVALSWTAPDVDWEFPLVSRVPEAAARLTLLAFLRQLRAKRWLDAPLQATQQKRKEGVFSDRLGLAVVAYGSTAAGRATASSDVDALVLQSEDQGVEMADMVEDVANEVSLMAPRPLQVVVREVPVLLRDKGWLPATLREEGIVVHDGLRTRSGAKDDRLWRFLTGAAP